MRNCPVCWLALMQGWRNGWMDDTLTCWLTTLFTDGLRISVFSYKSKHPTSNHTGHFGDTKLIRGVLFWTFIWKFLSNMKWGRWRRRKRKGHKAGGEEIIISKLSLFFSAQFEFWKNFSTVCYPRKEDCHNSSHPASLQIQALISQIAVR